MDSSPLGLDALTSSPEKRAAYIDHLLVNAPTAQDHHIVRARVRSVSAPSKHLRRIVVESPEFIGFKVTGPDEFFGLFMPQHGAELHLPTEFEGLNVRAAVAAMAEDVRPNLRWYTIRSVDSSRGTLTFDVVTHGVDNPEDPHAGPGLSWVLGARIGDSVGIWTCQGLWHRSSSSQTLLADPSAVPSVRAILEYVEAFAPAQLHEIRVVIVVESFHDLEPLLFFDWEDKVSRLDLIFAPAEEFGEATTKYLAQLDELGHSTGHSEYVWVAGEGNFCKSVRRHAIKNWGLPAEAVQWCPYWFLGKARP